MVGISVRSRDQKMSRVQLHLTKPIHVLSRSEEAITMMAVVVDGLRLGSKTDAICLHFDLNDGYGLDFWDVKVWDDHDD